MDNDIKLKLQQIVNLRSKLYPTSNGFEINNDVGGTLVVEKWTEDGFALRGRVATGESEFAVHMMSDDPVYPYIKNIYVLMKPKWEKQKALLDEFLLAMQ